MARLVLQPCADNAAMEHYRATIERPVHLSRIAHLLPESELRLLTKTFGDSVAIWRVTPGKGDVNAKKWRRMAVGDVALMYRKRRFFFKGEVAYKLQSPTIARELWGSDNTGETWEYIFFLSDLEEVDIDVVRFNIAAGYMQSNIIQGFDVLPEQKSELILEALELQSTIGAVLVPLQSIDAARLALADLGQQLDLPATSRKRAEQVLLRRILLGGKRQEACSVCARVLPVDLLVIGHIRKRHSCNAGQKLDLANVMPVCLLGCDKLFENGYIHVNPSGKICLSEKIPGNDALGTFVDNLVGRQCAAWSSSSESYFEWHREHRRRFL